MFYNTGIGTYVWVVTNRKERRRKGKVQLLDAREVWTAGGSEDSKRSLGDKRRHMTIAQIDEIVRLYGKFEEGPRSKIFDNADFGYTRVTIERPLRLRYQMTTDDKARFLDACPHLLDDVQAIDKALGREPRLDWSATWDEIEALLKKRGSRWKATEQKLFRSVFTQRDAKGRARASGWSWLGLRSRRRPARLRERAAHGGRGCVLRARGESARAGRVDGSEQGQGRLRDQLQPALLRVYAAARPSRDRR
jgi:type I restriction enzyme M protein